MTAEIVINKAHFKTEEFACVEGMGALARLTSIEHMQPVASVVETSQEDGVAKDKLLFSYRTILKTIESCKEKRYSDFDGHTTSNCCHGMALLASHLINAVLQLDLERVYQEGLDKIQALESLDGEVLRCDWLLPNALINLSCLYLLGLVKEVDPVKGGRTDSGKLKGVSPISTKFSRKLAVDLQRRFSNWVAMRYSHLLEGFDKAMQLSGAPVQLWGNYVKAEHVRTDKRGVKYASNLFSMQIVLAELIRTRGKVAIMNDLLDTEGNLKGRYVAIVEGDGQEGFRPLSADELKTLEMFHQNEPIVVFGGCAYSDSLDLKGLEEQMQPWLAKTAALMLACDIFYPQFCRVHDDAEFNSDPIVPSELELKYVLDVHSRIRGVSAEDPSLFCAAHICPASVAQVLQVMNGENELALPLSYVPGSKLKN